MSSPGVIKNENNKVSIKLYFKSKLNPRKRVFFLLISCGLETNKQTILVKRMSRFLSEVSHPPPQRMVIISSLNSLLSFGSLLPHSLAGCIHGK